ncbi:hypothetical protein [Dysgonomonas sp. 25]|uniref:hypothetical protein n=1 Tax=Dysgonomonas sp. 25 TaxID=2302933 RepID=UPI0013D6622D|nr:hypothetical protein [Dysgonomonas sp. 25]NDV68318.1 hypothetical protein [Dysgonomonas sp. 25]
MKTKLYMYRNRWNIVVGIILLLLSSMQLSFFFYGQDFSTENIILRGVVYSLFLGVAICMIVYSSMSVPLVISADFIYSDKKQYPVSEISSIQINEKDIFIRIPTKPSILLKRSFFKKSDWEDVCKSFEELIERKQINNE